MAGLWRGSPKDPHDHNVDSPSRGRLTPDSVAWLDPAGRWPSALTRLPPHKRESCHDPHCNLNGVGARATRVKSNTPISEPGLPSRTGPTTTTNPPGIGPLLYARTHLHGRNCAQQTGRLGHVSSPRATRMVADQLSRARKESPDHPPPAARRARKTPKTGCQKRGSTCGPGRSTSNFGARGSAPKLIPRCTRGQLLLPLRHRKFSNPSASFFATPLPHPYTQIAL